MDDQERWAQISDFPSHEVSSLGRVRGSRGKKTCMTRKGSDGHMFVKISQRSKQDEDGTRSSTELKVRIHELVLKVFLPNPQCTSVKHLNGDLSDNRLVNLAWEAEETVEKWKRIPIFPSYEISTIGEVRSFKQKRLLKAFQDSDGYVYVTMYEIMTEENRGKHWQDEDEGEKRYFTRSVHTLVAGTFIANVKGKKEVNHMNKIRHDNRLENLEWVTREENMQHAFDTVALVDYSYKAEKFQDDHQEEVWMSVDLIDETLSPYSGFSISSKGNVRGPSGVIRKLTYDSRGYVSLVMTSAGCSKVMSLHVMVARLFHPDSYKPGLVVNHIDGIKCNNQSTNLQWVTQSENIKHAYDSGLITKQNRRELIRVNDSGVVVGGYESLTEAEKLTGINRGTLQNAIQNKAISHGSRWFESVEQLELEVEKGSYKKDFFKVYQLKDGVVVNSFDSYPAAEEATGVRKANIYQSIKKNFKAKGFVWKNNRQELEDYLAGYAHAATISK